MSAVFGLGLTLTVAALMAAFHPGAAPLRPAAPPATDQARATRTHARRHSWGRPKVDAVWARRELTVWLPYWSMPTAYGSAIAHSAVVRTAESVLVHDRGRLDDSNPTLGRASARSSTDCTPVACRSCLR